MATFLAGLAFMLLSQAASAWGPLGHRAIGAVADALLAPGARAELARLLEGDRDRDGRPSGRASLAEVSLWADEILLRQRRAYKALGAAERLIVDRFEGGHVWHGKGASVVLQKGLEAR